jgi:hypothetical protein
MEALAKMSLQFSRRSQVIELMASLAFVPLGTMVAVGIMSRVSLAHRGKWRQTRERFSIVVMYVRRADTKI